MQESIAQRTVLLLCVLVSLSDAATWAPAQTTASHDLTLHETTTTTNTMGEGQKNIQTTNYFSGNSIKHSSSDGNDMIIRLDQGQIISIDNNRKTYTELTVQQLNEMFDKMNADMGKDAEQVEEVRKMLGQTNAVSVTKIGPGETIAGYATEKYLVTGPLQMEIWSAPKLKVPALYYDALKMTIARNPVFDMGRMYDEMKKITGMTLKSVITIKLMNMEMKTTTVVTSVETSAIPASTFAVPADYKAAPAKTD